MAQYATERSSGQCAGQINRQLNWHDRSSHDELDDTHVEGSVCRCAISSAFVPQLWVDVRQFANRVCILISFCFPFIHSFLLPILHMHIFAYMYDANKYVCARVHMWASIHSLTRGASQSASHLLMLRQVDCQCVQQCCKRMIDYVRFTLICCIDFRNKHFAASTYAHPLHTRYNHVPYCRMLQAQFV